MSQVSPRIPRQRLDLLLTATLAACRAGSLAEGLGQHPVALRWARRRWLAPVHETAGTSLPAEQRDAVAVHLLLVWALSQLRPDRRPALGEIDAAAWIDRTSWRPLLALACQHGFLQVPAFPERYRRRADESVLDNLCGLWAVGPSTVYRYLDKGKRLLSDLLALPSWSAAQLLALRQVVQTHIDQSLTTGDRVAWHGAQAEAALLRQAVGAALWHLRQAGDDAAFIRVLQRYPLEAANAADSDLLIAQLDPAPLSPRLRFDLALASAALWRARGVDTGESESYARALRIADQEGDALMLGVVYGALGKFNEARDADRAFAYYEDSVEQLRRAGLQEGASSGGPVEVLTEYANSLIRLAWLHVRRNDPRARPVLERAQQLSTREGFPLPTAGLLEQAWGEYWRCTGDARKALEHKHRALNVFEQIGDQRSILSTYVNLSLVYGEVKDYARAIEYGERVLSATHDLHVEPEVVITAIGNMGVAYFWLTNYDQAITHYREALELAERTGLQSHVSSSHFNLAEAHYKRYQQTGHPDDERIGDHHAAVAARMGVTSNEPNLVEASQNLKREVLGHAGIPVDRLLPEEFAAHFGEMSEIRRLRAQLALPCTPEQQAQIHLAMARAYLAMAASEREQALGLIHKHALGATFDKAFEDLKRTFERALTREQQLATWWQSGCGGLLDEQQRKQVLTHLLDTGAINKSSYAEVAGVSPATASKHLSVLLERGLLTQVGKGPSTRYLLPDEAT